MFSLAIKLHFQTHEEPADGVSSTLCDGGV